MREHFSGKLKMAIPNITFFRKLWVCNVGRVSQNCRSFALNVPGQLACRPLDTDFDSCELIPTECFGEFVALKTHCLLLLNANHVMCKGVYIKY